jgi:hypothetical protein
LIALTTRAKNFARSLPCTSNASARIDLAAVFRRIARLD